MESTGLNDVSHSRISFKIGSRAGSKVGVSSTSEETQNSLEESNSLKKLSGESVPGLSQASTLSAGLPSASQEDIFATQLPDSFALDNSPPVQSSGSTVGPADYEDFILASQSQDSNCTRIPSISRTCSPPNTKTSTPRKRRSVGSPTTGHAKLKRIEKETSSQSPKGRLRVQASGDANLVEEPYSLGQNTPGDGSSVPVPNFSRRQSDRSPSALEALNTPPLDRTRTWAQTRLQVLGADSGLAKRTDKTLLETNETITVDSSKFSGTTEENPEVKVLKKKSRESSEVFYVHSPGRGVSSQRLSQKNKSFAESQPDSYCFHLSYDSPTQTVSSQDDKQEYQFVRPESKSITIEDDDDQDCAVTYDDSQATRHNIPAGTTNVEKQKNVTAGGGFHTISEVNGTLHSSLKSVSYSCTMLTTWKVSYDPLTHKVHYSELIQCEPSVSGDVGIHSAQGLSDLSNGVLADVSDQSRSSSPTNVAGIGPFPLQPSVCASMVSAMSSSSTGTSSSAGSFAGTGLKVRGRPNFLTAAYIKDREVLTSVKGDQVNALQKSSLYNVAINEKLMEKIHRTSEIYIAKLVEEDCHFASPRSLAAKREKTEVSVTTKLHDFVPIVGSTPSDNETVVELRKEPSMPVVVKELCTPLQTNSQNNTNLSLATETVDTKSPELSVSETPKTSTKKRYNRSKSRSKRSSKSSAKRKTPLANETIIPEEELTTKNSLQKNKIKMVEKSTAIGSPAARRKVIVEEDFVAHDEAVNLLAFARWSDKHYYSGKILNQLKPGRYNILFDDGNKKDLLEEHVYIVEELPKGILVFAIYDDKQYYESGRIVDLKLVDGEIMYVVELDKNTVVTVPRSKLRMTEVQVKLLAERLIEGVNEGRPASPSSNNTDTMYKVVPDNILTGKRIRSLQASRAGYSGQGSNRIARLESEDMSSDDESGLEKEHYPRTIPNCKKGSKVEGNRQVKERAYYDPPPSKIFHGMYFLFTCSQFPDLVQACASGDFVSESSSPHMRMPFIKDALTTQLKAGGGIVLSSFDDIENFRLSPSTVYLVSNGPCLTATYLLCLCHNITILNHEWVIYSSLDGKKQNVNNYSLPAGYSIERQEYVNKNTGGSRRKKPLSNKNIALISGKINSTFAKFWTKILECLGATVNPIVGKPGKDAIEGIDIIVTASSLLGDLRDWAHDLQITAVSTEWVQQCVINWKECAVTTSAESPIY